MKINTLFNFPVLLFCKKIESKMFFLSIMDELYPKIGIFSKFWKSTGWYLSSQFFMFCLTFKKKYHGFERVFCKHRNFGSFLKNILTKKPSLPFISDVHSPLSSFASNECIWKSRICGCGVALWIAMVFVRIKNLAIWC